MDRLIKLDLLFCEVHTNALPKKTDAETFRISPEKRGKTWRRQQGQVEDSPFIQRMGLSILCARPCGKDTDEESKLRTSPESKGREGGQGKEVGRTPEEKRQGTTSPNSYFPQQS